MGDPKMLAMIGAFLGWKLTLLTLMIASLAGSVVGVGLIATGRGSMKYALPFGCFLAVGAAAAATVGPALLDWYLRRCDRWHDADRDAPDALRLRVPRPDGARGAPGRGAGVRGAALLGGGGRTSRRARAPARKRRCSRRRCRRRSRS